MTARSLTSCWHMSRRKRSRVRVTLRHTCLAVANSRWYASMLSEGLRNPVDLVAWTSNRSAHSQGAAFLIPVRLNWCQKTYDPSG